MDAIQFYKHKDFSLPLNYLDMYSLKIIADGIKFLDIRDANEIFDILKSCKENRTYLAQIADINKKRAEFINRFAIPRGLTKKQYKEILKETQNKIDNLLAQESMVDPEDRIFMAMEREDYIFKKEKIKKILAFHEGYGEMNISKAKAYPIEQIIEFNNAGFAKCINGHEDKTPSMKWYKNRNKAHCFSCNIDMDSIDAYQKINNVDFNTAVKNLTK